MRVVPTIALAAAVLAAALLPALAPSACPAQEKKGDGAPSGDKPSGDKPAPRLVERIYDVAGIRGPQILSTVAEESRDHLRPFGVSPGLYSEAATEEPTTPESYPGSEEIGELVRSCLPASISEEHTKITSVWNGAAIRVRTTEEGQKLVAATLESLRRAAVPFQFDVRAVTLRDDATTSAILTELDRLGAAPVPATLVDRLLAADTRSGLRGGSVSAYSGLTTRLERIETRSVVADWDVEIAQAASIADPVPAMVEDGLRALLHATPTSDGSRTLVRFSAASGELQRPIRRVEMRTKDLGSSELPELRGGFVATEWLTKAGETTAVVLASPVNSIAGTTAGVREVLLVKLVSAPPMPEPGAVMIVPVGSLSGHSSEATLVAPAFEPSHEGFRGCLGTWWKDASARCEAEEIAKCIRAADPSAAQVNWNIASASLGWPGGSSLTVTGTEEFRGAARATVVAMESELLRGAHVSVRLVARDSAGTSEKASETTLGLVSGPAMTGRNIALAAYTSVPYIGDYDVEVAQEARIADPRLSVAVGGLIVNVRLAQGPAEGWRADIDLTVASVGAVESMPVSGTEVGVLERCAVKRARASQPVILENGKSKEIDLGANPWGAGRLVAIIRVER